MNVQVHTVLFTIVTVAFLALAGVLIIFTSDQGIHTLAAAIITGILGLWVPSPVQPVVAMPAIVQPIEAKKE